MSGPLGAMAAWFPATPMREHKGSRESVRWNAETTPLRDPELYQYDLNILRHANAGKQTSTVDAETTPLRDPELYQYDLNLADITEVWRRGSVVASWLLDLAARALIRSEEH